MEIARVNITKSYSANIENTKTQKYTTPKIQKYIELAPEYKFNFFTSYRTTMYFMFTQNIKDLTYHGTDLTFDVLIIYF